MQILSTYKFPSNTMVEFDYLKNSLMYFYPFSTLKLDTVPAITRESRYRIKKPRSTNANPVCISAPYKHNGRV